ncbi:hypothetical protein DY000_02051768 [Brassica cretica]|uniref:Uncharacterized protein n=1 Tax=Brassica cretica TaxID=69181 RepID=A0ABQ7A924_BRACR|nr:hypothetical protein DY000_02051768 [Brassica cretica]
MVAQTICEDNVLNHRSKLPWMKRKSTNCLEQVAIDIIMNVPPWTNRLNRITTVDMSSRYCCDPCVDGMVESTGGVVLLICVLPTIQCLRCTGDEPRTNSNALVELSRIVEKQTGIFSASKSPT